MMKISPSGEGDQIEVSVTHEIKIAGDKAWVGVRLISTVRANETTEDAQDRVGNEVQTAVMNEIQRTVATVERFVS
jgi:hypothetical protein